MRPVQCPRCSAWCLLTLVNGFKVAADPSPLDGSAAREALIAGRSLYAVMHGFKLKASEARRVRGLRMLVGPRALREALDGGVCVGEHGCAGAFTSVGLAGPQRAVQSVCPGRAGCTRNAEGQTTCEVCDPAPFDAGRAFVEQLGASVVSIEVNGREVYCGERCCQPART